MAAAAISCGRTFARRRIRTLSIRTASAGRTRRSMTMTDNPPTPARLAGLGSPRRARVSRRVSLHPRHPADDVPRPALDDAAVRRVRDRGRVQPALPLPARAGRHRPQRRLRSADTDGLRLRPLRSRRARSAASASPSTRSRTWRSSSTASRSSRVSTSMTINATAIILLALYVAVGEAQRRRAVERSPARSRTTSSRSTSRAAPTSIRRGRRCASSPTSSRSASASCRTGTRSRSAATTSARPARRRSQEVAFTFANAIAYVEAGVAAGLDVNRFGQRLSFFFNAHNDFLEEIAKFRAARRLWARIMRDRFGATNPRAAAAALPHADGRQHADGAAARQQHRPRRDPGAGRGARRDAVAALQRPRRGAGAADRGIGAHRAPDAADHRRRDRRREHRRPVRRARWRSRR